MSLSRSGIAKPRRMRSHKSTGGCSRATALDAAVAAVIGCKALVSPEEALDVELREGDAGEVVVLAQPVSQSRQAMHRNCRSCFIGTGYPRVETWRTGAPGSRCWREAHRAAARVTVGD